MASMAIMYRRTPVVVGAIELDATLSEMHQGDAEVTAHPVERGVDVSDHIRRQPRVLQLVGVISDTPLYHPQAHKDKPNGIALASDGAKKAIADYEERLQGYMARRRFPLAGLFVKQPNPFEAPSLLPEYDGRAKTAWAQLERMKDMGHLVTVVTSLRSYTNMAITSLQAPRDATTGASLTVSITLQEVRTVESATAEIPPHLLEQKRGLQPTKPAPPQVEAKAQEVLDNRTGFARLGDAVWDGLRGQ